MKQHIPNILTLLNLFCGSIAVLFAVNANFIVSAFFVFLGIFFDFFDGFAARKLQVQSELGLQLDSLADMVTSGLVPGIVMYKLLEFTMEVSPVGTDFSGWEMAINWNGLTYSGLPLFGLLITIASAYRLAKFNIDDEQQTYFKGLPTPANALLVLSLPLIVEFQNNDAINTVIFNRWFLLSFTVLSAYLLNSNIKLFALKFKDFSFINNKSRYIFILLCMVLLVVLKFVAIPCIILLYIFISVLENLTSN
ncbi:CDP-alcohol phosphatidyltransferase family protein [Cognatitamlana onchidii]|uniref:CDP-alcohol phosphatidyltransferase family protein n=1 Tax=Cognatitamlana onchidii TaxID=2562860 RepID=UPI0010A5DA1B|nr:CDP-alcohol phosphatidyltransferase family protein [Algibacter onchidii]